MMVTTHLSNYLVILGILINPIYSFYPTYNLDLEPNESIEVSPTELNQLPANPNGYKSIYIESEKTDKNAFIDILMENIQADSNSCPLGIFHIDQNNTISEYDEQQERIWIFVPSYDFNLTLCSDAIHNNSNLIVKRFETTCFKRFTKTDINTFSTWIPAWNGTEPFRCIWFVENPDKSQVDVNFSFRYRKKDQPIGHELDFLVAIESNDRRIVPTIVNQTSMRQMSMDSQLIAMEYIALQPVGKQLKLQIDRKTWTPQYISTGSNKPSSYQANTQCYCGTENIDQRIVGGHEVNPKHRYPWMVAFLKLNGEPFCGGTVITNQYILTAAHCFDNSSSPAYNPRTVKLAIGAHDLTVDRTYYRIRSIKMHENYKKTGSALYNDIALVKIDGNLTFDQFTVAPICLPSPEMVVFNNLTVAGWGFTNEDGAPSKVLRDVTLPYVTNRECQEFHGEVITSSMMCAGGNQDEDSCQGDSGSPLMFRRDGALYAVGLVSFGLGCGRPFYYGVYTRTSRYLKWIQDNTIGSKSCPVYIDKPSTSSTPMPSSQSTPRPTSPGTNIKNGINSKPIYPNLENCGIMNIKNTRVIGGKETNSNEYPWMAALGYRKDFIGGGVVVAPYYILTSARKIKSLTRSWDFNLSNLTVILGGFDLTAKESSKELFKVSKISFHPLSSTENYDYDYALLKLAPSRGNQNSFNYRPICLPRSSFEIIDGITTLALGWGSTVAEGSTPTNKLRQVKLDLITASTCRSFYQNVITNTMFCAAKPGADVCFGDDGGPLMYPFRQRWYLLGVFSWKPSDVCAFPRKPSIFTDVRHALPWITFVTGAETL
ncbi:transmembrane protease serine 9 [Tetranychus urticae]|uniref:limulus clotting factor C n=1 Tax=Tetranychus urticae TaxID=32264 RepID=T1KVF6_TETUR|nr:transmembrane protease serine 9 [Tetranychus urticae]